MKKLFSLLSVLSLIIILCCISVNADTQTMNVTFDNTKTAEFTVLIPKTITLGTGYKADYTVSATITSLPDDEVLYITPDSTFSITNDNKSVNVTVSQAKDCWTSTETSKGTVIADSVLTMGKWIGSFNFSINIDMDSDDETVGFFDENDNLVVSWKKSGIDVSTNYTYLNHKTAATSGYSVLQNYPNVVKVVIPDTATSISNYAFYNCENLKVVKLPSNLKSIGSEAFGNAGISSIDFPTSITSISSYAFEGCTNLTSVNIPTTIDTLSMGIFSSTGLTSVDIPSNIKTIEVGAFSSCDNLVKVSMTNNVTSLEANTFSLCTKLRDIELSSNLSEISSCLFSGCSSLVSISIPNKITSIEDGAFSGAGLKSIVIPDNVTYIGTNSFAGCESLSNVTLGNSVETIEFNAFADVPNLTNIKIPKSVTYIGSSAFSSWENGLTSVNFENTNNWYVDGELLDSTDLSNPETAALYLAHNYSSSDWKRS